MSEKIGKIKWSSSCIQMDSIRWLDSQGGSVVSSVGPSVMEGELFHSKRSARYSYQLRILRHVEEGCLELSGENGKNEVPIHLWPVKGTCCWSFFLVVNLKKNYVQLLNSCYSKEVSTEQYKSTWTSLHRFYMLPGPGADITSESTHSKLAKMNLRHLEKTK